MILLRRIGKQLYYDADQSYDSWLLGVSSAARPAKERYRYDCGRRKSERKIYLAFDRIDV